MSLSNKIQKAGPGTEWRVIGAEDVREAVKELKNLRIQKLWYRCDDGLERIFIEFNELISWIDEIFGEELTK